MLMTLKKSYDRLHSGEHQNDRIAFQQQGRGGQIYTTPFSNNRKKRHCAEKNPKRDPRTLEKSTPQHTSASET